MREAIVDFRVWLRRVRAVIPAVLVELCNRADDERDVGDNLEREEQRDTEQERRSREQAESQFATIKHPFLHITIGRRTAFFSTQYHR